VKTSIDSVQATVQAVVQATVPMSEPVAASSGPPRWRRVRVDRPVAAIVLVLVAIAVAAPAQLQPSLVFTASSLLSIAPFLLLAVTLAAYARASGADRLIADAFAVRPAAAIPVAALFGALSPFCSCGVVPVVAGLLGAGVPLAPVMAFWIASPLMDPAMFVLTSANLGLEFAVVKTVSAIALGVAGGLATQALASRGLLGDVLRHAPRRACGAAAGSRKAPHWRIWTSAATRADFVAGAAGNGWMLLRWMTIAFLLESLMLAWLPAAGIASLLGSEAGAIPLAVLVSVPAYLNGYAALPLVRGLVELGMSPAVGLAFLVAGGITSIPAAMAVWAVVKPRIFGLYIAIATLGALGVAWLYAGLLALR
jgi:uncharacterized protein